MATRGRRTRKDLTGAAYRARRAHVIAASGGICYLCGKAVNLELSGRHPDGPTVDHVISAAMGGDVSDISNLRLAHQRCNRAKGTKLPSQVTQPETPSRDW